MPLVECTALVKTYRVPVRRPGFAGALAGLFSREHRSVRALDGLSFTIDRGECVGYVGPNGAGKSTTVKILSGILTPDEGTCRVLGRVPWEDRVAHVARIGVVFGQRTQLWWDLPVRESLGLLADIYSVDPAAYRRTRDELADTLELGALLDAPARSLSLGQRMRCDLAASLVHEPEVVYLDEPTIGLDAVSKQRVREFLVRRVRERGTTVLLTTHDMDDIEALCRRILVIGSGRVLFDGSIEALRGRVAAERRLVVELAPGAELPEVAGATLVLREGDRYTLRVDPARVAPPALIADLAARCPLRDVTLSEPPVEELVAKLWSGDGLKR